MANTKDYLDSILSDNEKTALAQFFQSEVMREAVKKVLLAGIYNNGTLEKDKPADPLRNFAIGLAFNDPKLTNEQIGADLRSSIAGINSIEAGFSNIAKYVEPLKPEKAEESNPAR